MNGSYPVHERVTLHADLQSENLKRYIIWETRMRMENTIKMDLKETEYEIPDWVHRA
jgi:hypothetical protein